MNRLYTSYSQAEGDCDMIAGDNGLHMAVVECFDLEDQSRPADFAAVVVNIDEADAMVEEHGDDREIIYDADYSSTRPH